MRINHTNQTLIKCSSEGTTVCLLLLYVAVYYHVCTLSYVLQNSRCLKVRFICCVIIELYNQFYYHRLYFLIRRIRLTKFKLLAWGSNIKAGHKLHLLQKKPSELLMAAITLPILNQSVKNYKL